MTSIAADVLIALVAFVTAVPSLVALRPVLAQRLYALDVASLAPTIAAIVEHRAVFFGVVAALLAISLGLESWRAPALFAAIASKLAFVVLARKHGALAAIARTDVVLLVMLGGAAALDAT